MVRRIQHKYSRTTVPLDMDFLFCYLRFSMGTGDDWTYVHIIPNLGSLKSHNSDYGLPQLIATLINHRNKYLKYSFLAYTYLTL